MPQQWSAGASGPMSFGRAQPTHNHFNNDRSDDPMGTMHSAAEQRGAAHVNVLKSFFGQPLKGRSLDFSDAVYEQENEDYPEAFNQMWGGGGDGALFANNYLKSVLIEKAKASETWQLTIMAPWRASGPNDGLTYTWSQIRFNSHMLDREPEESVPRLLSHTRTSGSVGLIRYGIALLLEANFASTQAGVQMYLHNLEQIRIATVETCSYGAAIAVLHNKPYEDPYSAPYKTIDGQQGSMSALNRMFKDECAMWAIVQKDVNGYGVVANKLRKLLQSRPEGKSGNFTVVPNGMAAYLQTSQDKAFYQNGLADTRRISSLSLGSETVVDSRPFNMGEHTVPHDPWWTNQSCGDTMSMDDASLRSVSAADYKTDMMDIMGYNGETDSAEHMFRYRDHYKAVGAWQFSDPNAPLSEHLGTGYMQDYACYTWGQLIDRNASNPERVIDAIHLLQGEKRTEFMRTLRVLPQGDKRAQPGNCGFNHFTPAEFETMRTPDFVWQTFGVAERAENKRKADLGIWDESNAEMDRVDRERAGGKRQRLDARSPQTKYDEYERKQGDVDDDVDMYVDDEAQQRVTRRLRSTHPYMPEPASIEPSVPSERLARDLLRKLVAPDCPSAASVVANPNSSAVAAQLAVWVQRVSAIKGATETQIFSLLTELQRVATSELVQLTKAKSVGDVVKLIAGSSRADAALFDIRLIVNFVPLLAACQTRFALNQLGQEQTPLERAVLARGDNTDLANVDDSVALAGQWNPSGLIASPCQEDGQVRIALDASTGVSTSVRLPHDSYAATLAAEHNVLFNIDTESISTDMPKLLPLVAPGIKQSRTDALVWSIVLSQVAGGRIGAGTAAVGAIAGVGAIVPADTLKRLKRVLAARGATINILPCQEHLRATITAAYAELGNLVRIGWFTKPAIVFKQLQDQADVAELAAVIANGYRVKAVLLPPVATNAAGLEIGGVILQANPRVSAADLADLTGRAVRIAAAVFTASTPSDWPTRWRRFLAVQRFELAADLSKANPDPVAEAKRIDAQVTISTALYACLIPHYTAKETLKPAPALSTLEPAIVGDGGAPFAWTRANIKAILYRASVVCGLFHQFCVENDIPVCFALRTWRNAMTYSMGCMLRMQAGKDGAARTIYKDPNFMMGDNVAQKMIYGHFTMYSQTIVFRKDWVVIAKNIFSNGYVGGAGVSLWDPLNREHLEIYADDPTAHDMFVVQVPMTDAHGPNSGQTWRSMTGVAPSSLGATAAVNEVLSYPGAAAVSAIWHWKSSALIYGHKAAYAQMANTDDVDAHRNVICMQAFQMRYNPVSREYDNLTINSGHWGQYVYTGMRQVIDGHKLHFDVPTYMKLRVIGTMPRS